MADNFIGDKNFGLPDILRRQVRGTGIPYVGAFLPIEPGIVEEGVSTAAFITNFASLSVNAAALDLASAYGQAVSLFNTAADLFSMLGVHYGAFSGLRTASIGSISKLPIVFQYFPETISDQKRLGVVPKGVLKQSDPVASLSEANVRTISFRLQFSQETWDPKIGAIYQWDKYNFDVAVSVNAVRSFVYVNANGAPQPVKLILPGTRLGGDYDWVSGYLVEYQTEYKAFFPDGSPRLADMNVTFEEYPNMARPLLKPNPRRNVDFEFNNAIYCDESIKVIAMDKFGDPVTRKVDVTTEDSSTRMQMISDMATRNENAENVREINITQRR